MESAHYDIRDVDASFSEVLRRLHARCVRSVYPSFLNAEQNQVLEAFLETTGFVLDSSFTHALAAFEGEKVVGFSTSRDKQLKDLFVDPDYFGSGVGSLLLKSIQQRIGPNGWLTCREGNTGAHEFYRRKGLQDCGVNLDDTRGGIKGLNMPNRVFRWSSL